MKLVCNLHQDNLWPIHENNSYRSTGCRRGGASEAARPVASSIIGGGAHIHIFVFADYKNNRFKKETDCAEHEYINMWDPPPIIELVTGLEAVFPKHTKIKFFYYSNLLYITF